MGINLIFPKQNNKKKIEIIVISIRGQLEKKKKLFYK